MQYYIHRDNQQLGPYTEAEIKAQLAAGTLSPQDHVWWEGQASWIPLAQTPLMAAAPPIPGMAATPLAQAGAGALQPQKTSTLAIWALVSACVGILCGILQILTIILGHISLSEIKKNPALKGRGMAITSLVIGYVWLAIVIVCVVISVTTALNSNVRETFTTIEAQLKAQQAATNNAPDQSATNSDQTTNGPDQNSTTPASTNSPDQSTNSAPASTNAPDQSTNAPDSSTNTPATNSPDASPTNAPSTNATDSPTNTTPMSQ